VSQDPAFDDLMARLRAGDREAAEQVFRRFAHRLIGLARSQLDSFLRSKVDPEDVVQSVFRSFFARRADGRLDVENWDSLWRVLTVITVRKCGRQIERFHTRARDCRKEISLEAMSPEGGACWEALASDPTPSEAAMLAETVEQLLRGLKERERPILVLKLQGCTIPEISTQLGRSERTVYRVLERVQKRLEQMRGQETAET
jgi:RNA polymerase sigma-70 factor (ECF subfamily)